MTVGTLHLTGVGNCEALVKVKYEPHIDLEENVWNFNPNLCS